ncbi:hypothetical protein BV25DRAFT_1592609 [Artomyces pyxidatus]|uniref:Uncharacterized protein n=1 Tax=Artomyces pyxidatus TaxID=48021 RepID=A0ACB8TAB7_9AGAM|nr:hypothetical protein BV25DRAFT_1592609 [Artomyces pyxidatus]
MIIKSWVGFSTPRMRDIVRTVLNSHPDRPGLTTQELFKSIHEKFPDVHVEERQRRTFDVTLRSPKAVANAKKAMVITKKSMMSAKRAARKPKPVIPQVVPERVHIVRSLGYLKRIALSDMLQRGQVEKIKVTAEDGDPPRARKQWVWRLLPEQEKGEQQFKEIRRPRVRPGELKGWRLSKRKKR